MILYPIRPTTSPSHLAASHARVRTSRFVMRDRLTRFFALPLVAILYSLMAASTSWAGEADLILPDMGSESFLGISGRTLLMAGLVVCLAGAGFGLFMFARLRNLPVHQSMRDVSELIYATCKTYLFTQGKFILLLELFIGSVMVIYFGWLRASTPDASR